MTMETHVLNALKAYRENLAKDRDRWVLMLERGGLPASMPVAELANALARIEAIDYVIGGA